MMGIGHISRTGRASAIAISVAVALGGTSTAAQAQAGVGGVEEIVVTARKREESLQDVPVAVSAFSAAEITARRIESLADVAALTPGFNIDNFGSGGFTAPVIRGLSQTRLSNPEQNVSTFLDGVYLQRSYMIDIGFLDIERIEVVKGPQSALYGRNSFAGAINYVTRTPSDELEAEVRATVGSDDRRGAQISLSGPVIEDLLAARVTYGRTRFDGTWRNQHPLSDRNLGGYDNEGLSIAFRLTPDDSLELNAGFYRTNIAYDHQAQIVLSGLRAEGFGLTTVNDLNCGPGGAFSIVTGGLIFGNQLFCGTLPSTVDQLPGDTRTAVPAVDPRASGPVGRNDVIRLNANWTLSDTYSLIMQYGRTKSDVNSLGDASRDSVNGSPVFGIPGSLFIDSQPNGGLKSDALELKLESDAGEGLRWTVGGYYSKVEDRYIARGWVIPAQSTAPFTDFPTFGPPTDTTRDDRVTALFGAVGFGVGARTNVNLEGRYTREKKSIGGPSAPNLPDTRFSNFTPRLTVDHSLTEDSMVYGSIARGEKTGGFNRLTATPAQFTYDPETNWTYEIGYKSTWLDNRLLFNASIYYVDWSDLQINVPEIDGPPLAAVVIDNIGGASSLGIEIDGQFIVTDNLSLLYGLSINDPKFDSGTIYEEARRGNWCANEPRCDADGNIGGNKLSRTSRRQGVVGAVYAMGLGGDLEARMRADLTYQSSQYAEFLNVGELPSRTLVNVSATLSGAQWEAQLWMKNAFDREYAANSFFLGFSNSYVVALGDRRTWGLDLNYRFGH